MTVTIDVAQIILAAGTLLTAVGSLATVMIGLRNGRISRENANNIADTKAKVEEGHLKLNGVAERAEEAARAVGNLQGRAEQTAERLATAKEDS